MGVSLLVISLSSCFKMDENENPQFYSFATVNKIAGTQDSPAHIVFVSDSDKQIVPLEGTGSLSKLRDGQRCIVYFDIVNGSPDDNEPVDVKFHYVDTSVVIGSSVRVKTEEELKKQGDGILSINIQPYAPQLTPRYFNFYVGYYGTDPAKHKFSLVYNEADPGTDKTLYLYLCHDTAHDTNGFQNWHWVSLPVNDMQDLMTGKDMATVYVQTGAADIQKMDFILKDK